MQLHKKALLFLFVALLFAAPFSNSALAKRPVIFVSILPQKYFVEQIAGDTVDVEVMVMPGASPATYEPRPRQMAALAKADVYLAIGVPFERTWLPRIQSTNPKLKIVHVEKKLRKLPMAANAMDIDASPRGTILHDYRNEEASHPEDYTEHNHAMHEHKGMLDPHVWLSPRWVKAMTKPTRLAISKVAPEHAKLYRINARAFTKKLDELDEEIDTLFKPIPAEQRAFMTFHPSWGYYAMTYNLIQIPIEFEGKAPTPKVLEQITSIAKKRNLRTIFVQPQFSQSSARAIADSINASIIVANPLAENWEENLREVSKKLAASFILSE
ncbi:metal ABC transporter solute-binding protein, Zn/Mn family [Halodesulfovibrio aestuarii]|uniref:Zinc transport system substrate-binding protein n=1 Tax=Halodesulfovibrio aestuarii TaxID=126333 RepID=A0A8G2F9Y8_9BACT|nr:zinc ABC transporter substrate-binding protein [Halodesulfovibrio aestuarii]SHI56337.1 zinc transport system substrate-binding protein [Halodesulfovibrio aestuarii]